MLMRREARVGLVVFAALLVLIAVYVFLSNYGLKASSYPIFAIFEDVQKLDKGADVRLAGVKVGVVSDIHLTGRSEARVDMLIWQGNKIPRDSMTRITTGGFIGDYYVEIIPGTSPVSLKPNSQIASQETVKMEQLISQVGVLITEFQKTAKGINKILDDQQLITSVKQTVLTLNSAVKSADKMIQTAQGLIDQASPHMSQIYTNLATTSENAVKLSDQLNDVVASSRPDIKTMLSKASSAVTNLDDTMAQAKQLMAGFEESPGKINATLDKFTKTAEQTEQMMTNLNEASAGIKDLTTDKQMLQNIKSAVCNTAQATEQARELITTLNKKYGSGKAPVTPEQKAAIPLYGLSADGLWNTGKGEYRFDANYTFAGDPNSFYRVGAYNIGESTKLNLQGGQLLSPADAVRYGLYASRLGIGYDHHFGRRFLFSSDLFRPNEPQLEVRGIYSLTEHFGFYGGIQDLFHEDDRNVLLGIQYQQ